MSEDQTDGQQSVKRSVSRIVEFGGYTIRVITEWWQGDCPVPDARVDPDAPGDCITNSIRNVETGEITGPF